MSLETCAVAIHAVEPDPEAAVILLAIAGAETHWTDEPGDPLTIFTASEQEIYSPWAIDGYTSFGSWQVNLRWNHNTITALSGLTDVQELADWLEDSTNCAQAAIAIRGRQGLGAWSTYRGGQYSSYLTQARSALEQLGESEAPTPPEQAPTEADLVNLIGYLQGDVADAITSAVNSLATLVPHPAADEALAALGAAINTLRTAGK